MPFIFTAGSLAVSVTDMTAPVVGSSGGVYALVSAHLANVVMVSFCVCMYGCVYEDINHIPSNPVRSLFETPAGASPPPNTLHSSLSVFPCSSKITQVCRCVHMLMWQSVNKIPSMHSPVLYCNSHPSNIGNQTHFCCSSKWTSVSYFAHHGFQQVPLIIFKVRM